jgi:hypothetical protein
MNTAVIVPKRSLFYNIPISDDSAVNTSCTLIFSLCQYMPIFMQVPKELHFQNFFEKYRTLQNKPHDISVIENII